MGGPSGPAAAFAGRAAREALGELVSHARSAGRLTRGHHNLNYIVPPPPWLDQLTDHKFIMVRERQRSALPVVIRTWQDEAEILEAIGCVLPHVPRCLLKYGDIAVMSYVDGVPLSSVCPNGKPVDQHLVRALAVLLADMTQVGRKELPPCRSPGPGPAGTAGPFCVRWPWPRTRRSVSATGTGSAVCSRCLASPRTPWCGSPSACPP